MKANIFFLTVLFAFSALLCKGEAPVNYQSTDTLYATMGQLKLSDTDVGYGAIIPVLVPPEEFLFAGDDILSYNLATKKIVFTNSVYNKIELGLNSVMNLYFNDKLLLENIGMISFLMSWAVNDLVLFSTNTGCYLSDGYPMIDNWPESPQKEVFQQVRDENAQKRKAGWDIFINYLSENGKIVGTDITGVENAETTLPVQIYSAGKTIYVDNRTGKTGVVTVYSIAGVKIAEQTMAGQTTTLEIPVGGFYAVSVKAGNEKPVTAKLIVR